MRSLFTVNGKPFFTIGGQVHNSSTHSRETLQKALDAIDMFGMNTIAAPLYWYQVEPQEGTFNFEQIDFILDEARKRDLKVVFLWFGTWKNGASHYVPAWVKKDKERFLWIRNKAGAATRILSPLCEETRKADMAAYTEILKYVKENNADGTVIGIQAENEPGQLGTPRDYSPVAEALFQSVIPEDMRTFLETLSEGEIYDAWCANGKKLDADWQSTFGLIAEETFSAYCFSKYINTVAKAGKEIYPLPVYVNVWIRESNNRIPGIDYPSGGATTLVLDLWKYFSPDIDCICPDMYIEDFGTYDYICSRYKREDNLLYIPESRATYMNAINVFQAIAKYDLSGIHCFGIDSTINNEGWLRKKNEDYRNTVAILTAMKPLLEKYIGTGKVYAVGQYEGMDSQFIDFGDFYGRVYFLNSITDEPYVHLDTYHDDEEHLKVRGKGLIIYEGGGSFYLAGDGYKLVLIKKESIDCMTSSLRAFKYLNARNQEIISVEEGVFDDNGNFKVCKVRCGDESDMGIWVNHDIGLVHAVIETD